MYTLARGFVFRKMDSVVHRLDPRIRLLFSVELFALALGSRNLIYTLGLIGTIAAIAATARVIPKLGRLVIFSGMFSAMIFVIYIVTGAGFELAFIYATRFIAIVSSASLFFLTTSPDELEQVMKSLHLPRDFVFAFVTAIRFVPVLMLDAVQIMDAQRSRGLELDKGNVFARVRNLFPVLVPLIVNAVVRSSQLAEAMESRAYGATKNPTSLYVLRSKSKDKALAAISLAITITLYVILGLKPF